MRERRMLPRATDIYAFGEFELDAVEKTLRRGDTPIAITPKVFETLFLFVRSPGHLIEKDELMRDLWGGRIVEESNLTFNIKMLRKALGDDAQNPRFLETLPKRGYRFIAEVQHVNSNRSYGLKAYDQASEHGLTTHSGELSVVAGHRRPTSSEPTPSSPRSILRTRSLSKYLLAFSAVAIPSIALLYYFLNSEQRTPSATGTKTIAVLPIRPIDSGTRDEDYEIGIADALINRINSMKGVLARPLNSTRKYTDLNQDVISAGREQKVDYVLSSNYQLAGGKIRVVSQLISIPDGSVDAFHTVENDIRDLFAMQDAISVDIGNRLLGQFSSTIDRPVIRRGTENEDAYRLYLQAMYLYDRRTLTDSENAVSMLDQATGLDPSYAKAWAGKAHVHRSLGNFSGSRSPHVEYEQSIAAVNKALELDEDLADAHSALCENKFFYEYDFAGAERECKRAVELDPNSSLAHEIYSRCLWTLNRFD